MRTPSIWITRALVCSLAVVALAGIACGPAQPVAVDRAIAPGVVPDVGSVSVSIADTIDAERRTRFDKAEGASRLGRAIESELTRVGRFNRESPRTLDVQVVRYRMRSGAAVVWWGIMSGSDFIEVKVAAREGDRVIGEYTTGAGSSGAYKGVDQVSRFEGLATAVAKRVVAQL